MKKLIIIRRVSQAFFASLFVYILWAAAYPLEGMLHPTLFFATNPLIQIIISITLRVILPGIYISFFMLLLTFIIGRFFCGWICPLGFINDVIGSIRYKKKLVFPDTVNSKLSKLKFVILTSLLALSLAGFQAVWIFDPIVIAGRFISINFIPAATLSIDRTFVFCIQKFGLLGAFYDLYREMKMTVLGTTFYSFDNAMAILLSFLIIILPAILISRLWCRILCPLGALYSIPSKFSLLGRHVSGCSNCGKCSKHCRMGAIRKDASYNKAECILCMDCIYDCPQNTSFKLFPSKNISIPPANNIIAEKSTDGISRKNFLLLMTIPFLSGAIGNKSKTGLFRNRKNIIRPPGSQDEKKFLDLCIRCGTCMKACITNGLQPAMLESGIEGIWSPRLIPEIGYCEYNCNLCGNVCPTGAIPRLPLAEKKKRKIGIASVNKSTCLGWAQGEHCLVCEEHCPIPNKAIKIEYGQNGIPKPVVDENLCIGCGICQNKCPVRPIRAIRVETIA